MKTASTLPAVLLGTLLSVLASGCATEDGTAPAADAPRVQRVDAVTGSHISSKKAVPAQSDVERDKTVERMKELQERSQPPQKLPN